MRALLGLEHEYLVSRGGRRVDFRSVIHRRGITGRRLDPADPHAYRLPTGLKLTCDGPEAEIASPPVVAAAGFTGRLDDWAQEGSVVLRTLFPDLAFTGESTHLSVSVDDEVTVDVAGWFARSFGPALMLLMDDAASPGLLVRPRAGRVELGGEYVHGAALAAASALTLGGVRLCVEVATGRRSRRDLPTPARTRIVAAVDRWGWYLDRSAGGPDLLHEGRAAVLRRENRRTFTGQDLLEEAWKSAREMLEGVVDPGDLRAADDTVFGLSPLPSEVPVDRSPVRSARAPFGLRTAEGAATITRVRPGARVRPVVLDWDFAVFSVESSPRTAVVSVPAARLGSFVADLEGGRLDGEIDARLSAADGHLATREQAERGGWFASAAPGPQLAPPERDVAGTLRRPPIAAGPMAPRLDAGGGPTTPVAPAGTTPDTGASGVAATTLRSGGGGGAGLDPRFGKEIGHPSPPLVSSPWSRWWKGILAATVAAIAAIIGVTQLGGGDGGEQVGDPVPTVSAPVDGSIAGANPEDPTPTPLEGEPEGPPPTDGEPVFQGIPPDRLGTFALLGRVSDGVVVDGVVSNWTIDGVVEFAYEGDRIIGRVVKPAFNTGLDLIGQLGLCSAPQTGITAETLTGSVVFDLDANGNGEWFFFERIPAEGYMDCFDLPPEPVQVIFTDNQANASGQRPDGATIIHTMVRVDFVPGTDSD